MTAPQPQPPEVEPTGWEQGTWLDDAPRWTRTVEPGWWLDVLAHRDGTYSWASYGPGWRAFRRYSAGATGVSSAAAAMAAADQHVTAARAGRAS